MGGCQLGVCPRYLDRRQHQGDEVFYTNLRIREKPVNDEETVSVDIGLHDGHTRLKDLSQSSGFSLSLSSDASLYNVYSLDGKKLLTNARSLEGLKNGTYIVNGEKQVVE